MTTPNLEQLLAAGVHFGHQTRRWNPKMRRFIFAERNGIHIIDLQKTLRQLEVAQKLVRDVVLRGDSVLFVCTKAQVAGIVKQEAERCGAMYITERWLGGLLTNFQTVKKQLRRMKEIADTIAEARREAPVREESEEGAEGAMTYSSERGTEAAGDRGDERRRRRPRRRRAKPEAIAAHLKGADVESAD